MPVLKSDPFAVHRVNARGHVREKPSSTAPTEGEAKRQARRLKHATGSHHVVRPNNACPPEWAEKEKRP